MIAGHIIFLSSTSFNLSERTHAGFTSAGPLWLTGSLKSAPTVWSGVFHRVIGAKEQRPGRSWSLAKTPDFLLVSFDVVWVYFPLAAAQCGPPAGPNPTEPKQGSACWSCRWLGHSMAALLEVFMPIRKHSGGVYQRPATEKWKR